MEVGSIKTATGWDTVGIYIVDYAAPDPHSRAQH